MKKLIMKRSFLILAMMFLYSSNSFSQQQPKLSDAEIASVAVVANQIDIDYAKVAIKRSKNKDVIDFANRMADDHTAVINQAVALVQKWGVTPKDNAVSQSLLAQSKETLKKLNSVSKKDFNKTYIDNEVAYHEAVIGAVRDLLIPQSNNSELKDLLEAVLPALEAHLGHAKMAQSKFSK
jgi:putative membrane protein